MVTNNIRQHERKLRKIVKVIEISKEGLEKTITETSYTIEVYSCIFPEILPGTRDKWSLTPLTTYSVLQFLCNNMTKQRTASLRID